MGTRDPTGISARVEARALGPGGRRAARAPIVGAAEGAYAAGRMGRALSALARVAASAALLLAPDASGADSLAYVLAPRPETGELHVELTWVTEGRTQSALGVARRWGTLADVSAILHDVTFVGESSLAVQGPLWILEHRPGATLRCTYRVSSGARAFDWPRTHHPIVTPEFFCGMGSAFLLVPHDERGPARGAIETVLRWKLPGGWKAACSWGVGPALGRPIAPADLRQSVYLAGELALASHEDGGLRIEAAIAPRCGFDAAEFVRTAAAIVRSQVEFMREPAFPPYVATAIPVGGALRPGDTRVAGVGLHRSFALFVPPGSPIDDGVEHLFAHELFHYWNGGLLEAAVPERLVFWFVEGFTDYYALRILFESGRWDAQTYARWINRHVRDYHRNPALRATNQQIEERFWSDRETYGEVAYQRGLLLALRWHRLARDRGVSDGVDRLLRDLLAEARLERAGAADHADGASSRSAGARLTNELLRARGAASLGSWFAEEFDRYVVAAEPVDVPPDALAPRFVGRVEDVYEYALGFDRERSLRERRVHGLVAGSPAQRAGLREGDALAGWSLYGDADRESLLQVERDGAVLAIRFHPRGAATRVLQFRPAP